jgi:hypothetical protein
MRVRISVLGLLPVGPATVFVATFLYQSQGQSLQLPPSLRFPPLREGNRVGRVGSVPPACRGNLKEGVIGHTRFCELWLRDWYYTNCVAKVCECAGLESPLTPTLSPP